MLRNVAIDQLSLDQIEEVEKLSLRLAYQALVWFAPQAFDFFNRSPDDPEDIGEDITREAVGAFPGFPIRERLFGTIDFKQARWFPSHYGLIPQALMIDSKAKKTEEVYRLDLQMSQVSMVANLEAKPEPLTPLLRQTMDIQFEGNEVRPALTTVLTVHYTYADKAEGQIGKTLAKITLCAVPNGLLQERYSPSRERTVFNVGKHSSGRGEDPRVRIVYETMRAFAPWRVQDIFFDDGGRDTFAWRDVDDNGQEVQMPVPVESRLKLPAAGPSTT